MAATKIAIIGAGSASFGPSTLATILREPRLEGSELALVDLDQNLLEIMVRLARRMNRDWSSGMTIRSGSKQRELLSGSEFVVVSIEVPPRERLWQSDWEIPLRHGLRQPYAENGGPGGLIHLCRQIPAFLHLAQDMEQLCPEAWLINFSNPLPRITRTLTKHTSIKTVGKCHQINHGYAIAATVLPHLYGDHEEESDGRSYTAKRSSFDTLVDRGRRHFEIRSAGLNHLIWLLEIRDRQSGEDLYPAFRQVALSSQEILEPLTADLFRIFGYCPIAGDQHLAEYLPWLHDPLSRPWEKYNIQLYDWSGSEQARRDAIRDLDDMAAERKAVDDLRHARSEGAVEVINAIVNDEKYHDDAVNIPNNGSIDNLPPETIVEVPAVIDGSGVKGSHIGNIPAPIDELMRREAYLVEMAVDTAVSGDRDLALQTLLLDPMINDIDRARAILEDYLAFFSEYLPQFT